MANRFNGNWASFFQIGTHPDDPFPDPPPGVSPEGVLKMTHQIGSATLINVKHSGDPIGAPPHTATTDNGEPPSISFDRTADGRRTEYRGNMVHENEIMPGGSLKSSIRGTYRIITIGAPPAADVVDEEGTWTANRPPPDPSIDLFQPADERGRERGSERPKKNKQDS